MELNLVWSDRDAICCKWSSVSNQRRSRLSHCRRSWRREVSTGWHILGAIPLHSQLMPQKQVFAVSSVPASIWCLDNTIGFDTAISPRNDPCISRSHTPSFGRSAEAYVGLQCVSFLLPAVEEHCAVAATLVRGPSGLRLLPVGVSVCPVASRMSVVVKLSTTPVKGDSSKWMTIDFKFAGESETRWLGVSNILGASTSTFRTSSSFSRSRGVESFLIFPLRFNPRFVEYAAFLPRTGAVLGRTIDGEVCLEELGFDFKSLSSLGVLLCTLLLAFFFGLGDFRGKAVRLGEHWAAFVSTFKQKSVPLCLLSEAGLDFRSLPPLGVLLCTLLVVFFFELGVFRGDAASVSIFKQKPVPLRLFSKFFTTQLERLRTAMFFEVFYVLT